MPRSAGPDTEIAVVTPDSPTSEKNVSSVSFWNAAILPNIPDFCVCLRKYSESFSVVRRQRASMIIPILPQTVLDRASRIERSTVSGAMSNNATCVHS